MPEFPLESLPDQGERYLSVDPIVLEAIRELDWLHRVDPRNLPTVRLLLRVARLDEISGHLVLGLRFIHELGAEGVSGDPSPDLTSEQFARGSEDPSAQTDPAVKGGAAAEGDP
jgi:hypothetical protein